MSNEQDIQYWESAYNNAMNWARRKAGQPEEQMKEYLKAAKAQQELANRTEGEARTLHHAEFQRLSNLAYQLYATLHPEEEAARKRKAEEERRRKQEEERSNQPVANGYGGGAGTGSGAAKPAEPSRKPKKELQHLYTTKQLNGLDTDNIRYDDPSALKTRFEDLSGDEHDAKGLVLQHFERIRQDRQFQHLRRTAEEYGALQPSMNIFLYGPPGTGKSAFLSAMCHYILSNEEDSVAFILEPDAFRADLVGIAEKVIKEVFYEAEQYKNAIVCVDEIVGLCPNEEGRKGPGAHGGDTLNVFLQAIDGVRKSKGNVIVVGATNYPWAVDSAAISRLPNKFYLGLPDRNALASFLMDHARPFMGVDEAEQREMADYIASKLKNASYREIKNVAADLYNESDYKTKRANADNHEVKEFIPLTLDEVEQLVLKNVEIHASEEQLARYELFRQGKI